MFVNKSEVGSNLRLDVTGHKQPLNKNNSIRHNLPNGNLAMKESDGSQGNPTPALFSAVTRNWYS